MARKTNKTAHVLNLLTNGDSKEESTAPNIPIIESPKNEGHPLADIIKDSLDKEINSEGIPPETAVEETVTEGSSAVADVLNFSAADSKEADPQAVDDQSAVSEAEAPSSSESDSKEEAKEMPDSPSTQDFSSDMSVSEDSQEIFDQEAPSTPEEVEEDSFRMINVMELAVEERLMEFMNRFGLCTCKRCICDVKALAMTNLPSKYIVVDIASVAPLISFYKSKYSIYVVTELTKACLAVQDNPHH